MPLPRRARRTRRTTTVMLALALALAGCQAWHRVPVRPGEVRALGGGGYVQVTRADGSTYTLVGARVQGDSIVGQYAGRVPAGYAPRVALALADVRRVDERRVDPVVTTVAVLGTVAGAALVALGVLLLIVLHADPS